MANQADLFAHKPLELIYVTTEDDYSGPHGDVREDFREAVSGVPAVRGHWLCPQCRSKFLRRKPGEKHLAECDVELWIELNDEDKRIVIRAAHAMFEASKHLEDRMKDRETTLEQRIDDMGAEVALARILALHPQTPAKYAAELRVFDPLPYVNTYGKVPDIPIGRGIDVRHIQLSKSDLPVRDYEHHERLWSAMIGHFPRYGFAGWLVPNEHHGIRKDYGHKELPVVTGFPRQMRNYRIEDLVALL